MNTPQKCKSQLQPSCFPGTIAIGQFGPAKGGTRHHTRVHSWRRALYTKTSSLLNAYHNFKFAALPYAFFTLSPSLFDFLYTGKAEIGQPVAQNKGIAANTFFEVSRVSDRI